MHPRQRPPEQKAEALRLLAEVGVGEASRRTGIPSGTIASWGHREGVTSPGIEAQRTLIESGQIAWAERRMTLADRFGEVADKAARVLLERLDHPDVTVPQVISVIEAAVGKAQLLTGGSTSREEQVLTGKDQLIEEAETRAQHLRSA